MMVLFVCKVTVYFLCWIWGIVNKVEFEPT